MLNCFDFLQNSLISKLIDLCVMSSQVWIPILIFIHWYFEVLFQRTSKYRHVSNYDKKVLYILCNPIRGWLLCVISSTGVAKPLNYVTSWPRGYSCFTLSGNKITPKGLNVNSRRFQPTGWQPNTSQPRMGLNNKKCQLLS